MLLIVNYHYFKFPGKKYLASRGLSAVDFAKQLAELKKHYQPITFKSYLSLPKNKLDKKYVIVTIDDGLKDGLKTAWPVAKKLNFPITYFIAGLPITGQLLTIQKIHLLMKKIKLEDLMAQFYKTLQQSKLKFKKEKLVGIKIKDLYRYDTGAAKQFKLDLNYLLPQEIKEKIIDILFKKHFPAEDKIAKQMYLNLEEVEKLADSGMEIGGHSYSHQILSKLSANRQKREIRNNRLMLNIISNAPAPFSVPFGHKGTYNKTTQTLLQKNNFSCLVTMVRGVNSIKQNPYELKRFDVNDVFANNKLKKELL